MGSYGVMLRLLAFSSLTLFPFKKCRQHLLFRSYGDVTIAGKGLQILTYARHSWQLSREGSLTYHTYCDRAYPLWWSSPRTRDTHICCEAFGSGAVTTCFYDLGLARSTNNVSENAASHQWEWHIKRNELLSSETLNNVYLTNLHDIFSFNHAYWIRNNSKVSISNELCSFCIKIDIEMHKIKHQNVNIIFPLYFNQLKKINVTLTSADAPINHLF